MKNLLFLIIIFTLIISPAFPWEGYDVDTGSYIEIEKGNHVQEGNIIEVYEYDTGEYKDYEVQCINSDELELYDIESGEYKTFEMD